MKCCVFYNKGFARKKNALPLEMDILPHYVRYSKPNSLRGRLLAGKCEWCGCDSGQIKIKHVRKLKDLKCVSEWEQIMKRKRRKTLAVCPACYEKTCTQ